MRAAAILLGVIVLIVGQPVIYKTWQQNAVALGTLEICLGNNSPNLGGVDLDKDKWPWLAAVQAKCKGDSEKEKAALMETLSSSAARLNVIRALMPQEIDLAIYAVKMNPENSSALFWLGDLYSESGDPEAAMEAYEEGLENEPRDGLYWRKLGNLFEGEGDWEAAVSAYDKACYLVDRGKNGCPNAGRIYMGQGSYGLAANRYLESIEQLPYWLPAKRGLVEAYLAMGKAQEAVPYLQVLAESGDEKAVNLLEELWAGNEK